MLSQLVVLCTLCDVYYDVTPPDTYSIYAPFGGVTDRVAGTSGNAAFGQQANGYNITVKRVLRTSATSGNAQNLFKEQMLLAKKDLAEIDLSNEENDFLLADVPNSKELEELNTTYIMMARLQSVNNDSEAGSSYDSDFANEKTVSKKLNDASTLENAGNSMAPKSITGISHAEKEELKKKGIKSLSKLFSPKYLSPASIKELNKNLSAPKRVHFVNLIVILSTDSDTKEEVEELFDDETKEEEDEDAKYYNTPHATKELIYHEWLLNNPRPSLVKAKIRAENPSNIKISCMIGHFFKKHAYIDLKSPINIMSRNQYNQIMTCKLGPRKKNLKPK
ncbi:hypothetical protein Tco_0827761 [Tanacetum coccineum]